MLTYLTVSEEEGEEPIEIPTEEDGTLLLSTLAAQFPGACGLKFRNVETKAFRGVRLVEGKLLPPDEGWSGIEFICVYPKENKRKSDDVLENCTAKTKRIDSKFQAKCSDLVVLGLPWKTTDQELKEYFETYGELKLATVKIDSIGKSKGYGFIRYANYESQIRAMSKNHIIDGRYCVCKVPDSKGGQPLEMTSKVFIGRLTENITKDDLKDFFSSYGDIVDIFVPNPFRGFAFITFLDPYVAQGLCGEDYIIKGTSVNVLPANYKSKPKNVQQSKPNQNQNYNQSYDNKQSRDNYQQPSWSNNQMQHQPNQYQPQQLNEMPNLQTLGITTQVPPPSHVNNTNPLNSFANLSSLALAPTLLAAALNQAGLGSLLSNFQSNNGGGGYSNNQPQQGSSGPPQQQNQYGVPPPPNQQSLHNSQQSHHNSQQPLHNSQQPLHNTQQSLHNSQQPLHNSQQPPQQPNWGSSLYSVNKGNKPTSSL